MKLIVGLGNIGAQYEKTRHNAGFLVVDRLFDRHARGTMPKARFNSAAVETEISGEKCLLMKPTTLMNRSGRSVAEAVQFYKVSPVDDLLVIVDDLYLNCGQVRIRAEGGAGGHNGLADIERSLGTTAYSRCRVGIDPKPGFMDQADYVLGRFSDDQRAAIEPALALAADAAEVFAKRGIAAAMNEFNFKGKGGSTTGGDPGGWGN